MPLTTGRVCVISYHTNFKRTHQGPLINESVQILSHDHNGSSLAPASCLFSCSPVRIFFPIGPLKGNGLCCPEVKRHAEGRPQRLSCTQGLGPIITNSLLSECSVDHLPPNAAACVWYIQEYGPLECAPACLSIVKGVVFSACFKACCPSDLSSSNWDSIALQAPVSLTTNCFKWANSYCWAYALFRRAIFLFCCSSLLRVACCLSKTKYDTSLIVGNLRRGIK